MSPVAKKLHVSKAVFITMTAVIVGLFAVVFVLMGALLSMSDTADNLSALVSDGIVVSIDYGGFDVGDGEDTVEIDAYSGDGYGGVDVGDGEDTVEIDAFTGGGQSGVNIGDGEDTVNITGGADGAQIQGLNVTSDGGNAILQVQGSSGHLMVEATSGTLSREAKDTIVSLDGNTVLLISSDDDLDAYGQIVVREKRGIDGVSITTNDVRVRYRQPARFLGIFPVRLTATAVVDTSDRVAIQLPWYSFLFRSDTDSVKLSIESEIAEDSGDSAKQVYINSGNDRVVIGARSAANRVSIIGSVVGDTDTLEINLDGGGVKIESNNERGGDDSVQIDVDY